MRRGRASSNGWSSSTVYSALLGVGTLAEKRRRGAVDVYLATFLTPLSILSESDCPAMLAPLRGAFETLREEIGAPIPPALAAHRARMFERHLPFPIPL
jgi:hypothetical protein